MNLESLKRYAFKWTIDNSYHICESEKGQYVEYEDVEKLVKIEREAREKAEKSLIDTIEVNGWGKLKDKVKELEAENKWFQDWFLPLNGSYTVDAVRNKWDKLEAENKRLKEYEWKYKDLCK